MRLAGIEPAHPAPEAGALSIGLQAPNLNLICGFRIYFISN
jgi:hypothetical protein